MQFNQTSSFYRVQKEKLTEQLGSFKKKSHQEYMILVADAAATNLINTFFTELDIYKMGFYLTQSLQNRGRPTKKYVCVYLISPYPDKFELIVADFKDSPKYDAMYILALGTIPDDGITLLKSHKSVKDKLRGLSQIQLDFVPWLDNGFTLMMTGGFRKGNSHEWMRLTASKLTSVLLSMQKFSSFELVYPEELEEFSEKLQKSLQKSLRILRKYNSQSLESSRKPTRVLLFPRQQDYQSPMVRSYDYVSMMFDVLKVQSNMAKVQGKAVALDDQDIILSATKHMDLREACEYIQGLSEGLGKKSPESGALCHKQILQMVNTGVLKELIKTHQNIASQVNQQGLKLMAASVLQQTIVNGITQSGQKVNDREIVELVMQFLKTKQGLTELTFGQLIALCYFSLAIKEAEFDQVLNLCPVGVKISQKIKALQVNPTKLKEKNSKQRRDLFRHQPGVVQFYRKHRNDSGGLRVRNVGGDQKLSKKRQKHDNQTKTVLFVTDYIGVNQIVALGRESDGNLIVGSNCVVCPWGYLLELIDDK